MESLWQQSFRWKFLDLLNRAQELIETTEYEMLTEILGYLYRIFSVKLREIDGRQVPVWSGYVRRKLLKWLAEVATQTMLLVT
jgi:hypothetical protein